MESAVCDAENMRIECEVPPHLLENIIGLVPKYLQSTEYDEHFWDDVGNEITFTPEVDTGYIFPDRRDTNYLKIEPSSGRIDGKLTTDETVEYLEAFKRPNSLLKENNTERLVNTVDQEYEDDTDERKMLLRSDEPELSQERIKFTAETSYSQFRQLNSVYRLGLRSKGQSLKWMPARNGLRKVATAKKSPKPTPGLWKKAVGSVHSAS